MFRYEVTAFTGVLADMNAGQHCSEIRTVLIMPETTRVIYETDNHDFEFQIENFDQDDLEWYLGSAESIEEIFIKHADL